MKKKSQDLYWMRLALNLAKRGLGKTWPNPMVGAVIVKDHELIAQGYHKAYGGAHAEVDALNDTSHDVTGATMYVTLEPCSHEGKQPPCALKIIDSGIKRVVVAMEDPNPLVAGKGIAILREHGIQVDVGVMEWEARQLNEAFIHYITKNTPFVLYKGAMTLDGKVATREGDAKHLSCDTSRMMVQVWRSRFQAIMVGIGTVLADDPRLNTRIEGERSPVRVILDTSLRIPENARMLSLEDSETWIFTTNRAPRPKFEALSKRDRVRVIEVQQNHRDSVDLKEVMDYLAKEGIASVLLEGGPNVTYSMLEEGLIHKVALFVAPRIIGGRHAKSLVEGEGVAKLSEAHELIDMTVEKVGEDLLIKGYTEEGAKNVYGNH